MLDKKIILLIILCVIFSGYSVSKSACNKLIENMEDVEYNKYLDVCIIGQEDNTNHTTLVSCSVGIYSADVLFYSNKSLDEVDNVEFGVIKEKYCKVKTIR